MSRCFPSASPFRPAASLLSHVAPPARHRAPARRGRRRGGVASVGPVLLLGVALGLAGPADALRVVDLEDVGASLPPEGFYDGADGAGGFESRGVFFQNHFDPTFGSWEGFSYSNVTDNTTPGFTNQWSAFPGSGAEGSPTYAVGFALTFVLPEARIELPVPAPVKSVAVANTTFAALSMRDGDAFAKQFGGPDGTDPDWFRLTIIGRDAAGAATGSVEVYLADFRFDDPDLDFILDGWQTVDLSALGAVSALGFSLDSSDVGPFGMNTPAYFALDDLVVVPEPATGCALSLGLAALAAARRRRPLSRSRAGRGR